MEITRSGARSAEDRFVVQVTIASNGALLRGEQSGPDPHHAIDAVADILDGQISRLKSKVQRRRRIALSRFLAEPIEAPEPESEAETGRLVRTKQFVVEPMTPEDAVDLLELLGHDFSVFLNTLTDRLGVIYRPPEADYGLLDPQLA